MARRTKTINPALRRAGGFTLLESLIASVILALATVAVLGPILASQQQQTYSETGMQGLALARQLMEEIVSRPFADASNGGTTLGPEIGEDSRAKFDNVDDYHGYSDTTAALTTMDGAAVTTTGQTLFTRTVRVEYRAWPAGPEMTYGDFAVVTVTVTPSRGEGVTLRQMVTRVMLKR